jgi:uncharacterized protein (DUF1330 family)
MSAYVIGQLNIKDVEAYQEYLDGFMPAFERHGGELLATSSQSTEVLEGDWALPRTVIMRFPTVTAARSWYNDPEYQHLAKIRHRTADANLALIEGL